MPIPMIVDTDTASDDAVALIMALRAPEVDVARFKERLFRALRAPVS